MGGMAPFCGRGPQKGFLVLARLTLPLADSDAAAAMCYAGGTGRWLNGREPLRREGHEAPQV